jgi:hypothetical protein
MLMWVANFCVDGAKLKTALTSNRRCCAGHPLLLLTIYAIDEQFSADVVCCVAACLVEPVVVDRCEQENKSISWVSEVGRSTSTGKEQHAQRHRETTDYRGISIMQVAPARLAASAISVR